MQPKILVLDFGGILGTPNMRHPFKLISPRATVRTNLPSCTRAEDGLTTVTTFEKENCLRVAFLDLGGDQGEEARGRHVGDGQVHQGRGERCQRGEEGEHGCSLDAHPV